MILPSFRNPRLNSSINPRLNSSINYRMNSSLNPAINSIISPIVNASINPLINADIPGYYVLNLNYDILGYTVIVSDDVSLLFDADSAHIGTLVRNNQGGYCVFDLSNDWIMHLVARAYGFNSHTQDNEWIGVLV